MSICSESISSSIMTSGMWIVVGKNQKVQNWNTLESGINLPLCLFHFQFFSRGYILVNRFVFYYISLHILVGYVYSLCQFLQGLRLFIEDYFSPRGFIQGDTFIPESRVHKHISEQQTWRLDQLSSRFLKNLDFTIVSFYQTKCLLIVMDRIQIPLTLLRII